MFVGRKEELNYLEEKYQSSHAEFLVLYGRRRIGKTELLREFSKDKKHVFYSGHQITDLMQLNRITPILTGHFGQRIYSQSFDLWERVFTYIAENLSEEERTVVILDEFPYMVEGNKSIPSILQSLWDHKLKDKNILLVLCGSSMSFMEKELLSEKNPLYGRTTGVLKVGEMDFGSARGFYEEHDIVEQVAYYSILSGVPYYLSLIDGSKSFSDNIKKNMMVNGSVLFNETEFLLKQELREVGVYNSIISAVALGRTKSNEIVQLTGVEKTKLPYYLNNLIDLGIVKKAFPSTMKVKERLKSRSGLYMLDNSFFGFYYRFIYPNLSELLDGNVNIIYEDIIENQLPAFIGHEFEKISMAYLRKINGTTEWPLRLVKIGGWWNKNTEIDIVGWDVNKRYVFGECKWRNELIGVKVLEQLKEKSFEVKGEISERYYVLFSKSGFTEELRTLALANKRVYLIDLEMIDRAMKA